MSRDLMYPKAGNGLLKFRPVNLKYTRYASDSERRSLTPADNSKRKTLRTHRTTKGA